MKEYLYIFALLVPMLCGCHHIEEWDNDACGNFEALWTIVDEHYCFFEEKDVDWDEVHTRYRARVYNGMPSRMLFGAMSDMLDELRDGHVNLSASFNTSYYRKWWSDYPQNYNERLVQEYYLGFNYKSLGATYYAILPQNVGYLRWGSFSAGLGESNLDAILNEFAFCNGIIIDIRDNGGGNLTYAEDLIRRFLSERTLAGYMIHKTGPGRNDFSEPYPYYYDPAERGRLQWHKPVAILTNRSTFSAANNFVSIMQYLPDVYIVGARTGGGSGMPLSMELPNGWGIRLSGVSVLDAKGHTTESGIDPTEGCAVDLDPQLAMQGIDTILEHAINILCH